MNSAKLNNFENLEENSSEEVLTSRNTKLSSPIRNSKYSKTKQAQARKALFNNKNDLASSMKVLESNFAKM